jgi:hypothetical protein
MLQSIPANKTTLSELKQSFGLVENESPQFFTEWLALDTAVTEEKNQLLQRIKENFKYLIEEPPLWKGSVKMVILAPLLDLAEFYQPPFQINPELSVAIETSIDDDTVLRGSIDVLVLCKTLWFCVIEAKMINFSLNSALPQALSYMLASPTNPCFGLITNGHEFLFLKLTQDGSPQYWYLKNIFPLRIWK